MKTSLLPLFSFPLQLALVVAVCPLAAGTARAENPFKVIGAKAKQGFSKVTRAVHPRRIGTALKNVKNAAVAAAPEVRVRPSQPAVSYSAVPSRTSASEAATYRSVSGGSSDSTIRYPSESGESAISPAGYYTGSQYLNTPASGSSTVNAVPLRGMGPPLSAANVPDDNAAPDQPIPSTGAGPYPKQGISNTADGSLKQAASSESVNPAPHKPVRPAPPREDLPFGELVPGKTGFVHSPYSKQDLVDVSGIPTGTKVKCPYTGKTFRVP